MTLALLCQFTAQHVSDVNTSIFRSLRLLVALCRLTWGVLVLCSGIVCWWCGIRVQAEPLVAQLALGQPMFKYQDDARSNTHKIILYSQRIESTLLHNTPVNLWLGSAKSFGQICWPSSAAMFQHCIPRGYNVVVLSIVVIIQIGLYLKQNWNILEI